MAAHAFTAVQFGFSFFEQCDRLMSPVPAGDRTPAAADTFIRVERRKYNRVPLDHIGRLADKIKGLSPDITNTGAMR